MNPSMRKGRKVFVSAGALAATAVVLMFSSSTATGAEQAKAVPYLAKLNHGTEDLVPIVSFDVTAPPYSADHSGKNDCTKAFADALADASRQGGVFHQRNTPMEQVIDGAK